MPTEEAQILSQSPMWVYEHGMLCLAFLFQPLLSQLN